MIQDTFCERTSVKLSQIRLHASAKNYKLKNILNFYPSNHDAQYNNSFVFYIEALQN